MVKFIMGMKHKEAHNKETARRIKDQFVLEPISEQKFKNVSKPLLVYKLISEKSI